MYVDYWDLLASTAAAVDGFDPLWKESDAQGSVNYDFCTDGEEGSAAQW